MDRISILGLPVDRLTMAETLERIKGILAGPPSGKQMLTANAEMVVTAQDDAELSHIWHQAAYVLADGYGLVWAAARFNAPLPERICGVELGEEICRLSAQMGARIYLLGARPGVAEEARARLLEKYPQAQIVGTHHGYFSAEETERIVADIRERKTDVLFVALGTPRQEKWLYAHGRSAGIRLGIGLGGSFDVWAGRVNRAPRWMREHGLEWLYRVYRQPKRLPRLKALPVFIRMVRQAQGVQEAAAAQDVSSDGTASN